MRAGSSTVHTFTSRPAAWQASTSAASTSGSYGWRARWPASTRLATIGGCCRARPIVSQRGRDERIDLAHPVDASPRSNDETRMRSSRPREPTMPATSAATERVRVEVGIAAEFLISTFTPIASHASSASARLGTSAGRSADATSTDRAPVGEMGVVVDRELTVGGAAHVELDPVGPQLAGAAGTQPRCSRGIGAGGPAVGDHGRSSGHHRAHLSHMTIACRVPEEALAGFVTSGVRLGTPHRPCSSCWASGM